MSLELTRQPIVSDSIFAQIIRKCLKIQQTEVNRWFNISRWRSVTVPIADVPAKRVRHLASIFLYMYPIIREKKAWTFNKSISENNVAATTSE